MAYANTVDERYNGGYVQYPAGTLELREISNSGAVLASGSWNAGYGTLIDEGVLRDIDVYSLGILAPGEYTVDVDEYTWDFSNIGFGSISSFRVLDLIGRTVVSATSTLREIVLETYRSETFYLQIEGSYVGEAQYRASYVRTGEVVYPTDMVSDVSWTLYPYQRNLTLVGSAPIDGAGNASANFISGNRLPTFCGDTEPKMSCMGTPGTTICWAA